jgi:hypothetical protein
MLGYIWLNVSGPPGDKNYRISDYRATNLLPFNQTARKAKWPITVGTNVRQFSKQQISVCQATVTDCALSPGYWHLHYRYLLDLSLSHKNPVHILANYLHITRQYNPQHSFIFTLGKENYVQTFHFEMCAVLSHTVLIGKCLVPRILYRYFDPWWGGHHTVSKCQAPSS